MSDIFVLPSTDLTPAFTRTQGQQKNSLEGQMLQRGLFKGFKKSLCQLVQHQREVPGGMPLRLLGLSLEAIQDTSEIFIFAVINGGVAFTGAALKSTLLLRHHFVKMVHFAS